MPEKVIITGTDSPTHVIGGVLMGEETKKILAETRKGLKPPTKEEVDHAMAKWLFGSNADKIMAHAPWSFVLLRVMWKKGEEPWER